MKPVDYLLDRITMYRLLVYYLLALVGCAMVLGAFGRLPYSPMAIAFSAGYITVICWLTNKIFAHVFEAPVNVESVYITALILSLIITPYKVPHDILFLTAASGLAISSKFILAIRKKHIFNPAAIAVALTAAGAGQAASWWVGTSSLLPFVVIGGLLIVRKIHRGQMVVSFFGAVFISTIVTSILTHHSVATSLKTTTLHSSLFFLAFVMLTEPITSPVTKSLQSWYGVLVGALFPPQIHVLSLYSTPELALVVGNVYAYFVSPKLKLLPRLIKKEVIAPDSIDFIFALDRRIKFRPGQYMEWTLPHSGADSRGNRRYFTLASSPTEDTLRLGVKFYPNGSSYKRAMLKMNGQTTIAAGQLGGDFTMPKDTSRKLAFIAGGIGVTPYRSMLKYLIDTKEKRDIVMLYSERAANEIAYRDVFETAMQEIGTRTIYTLTGDTPPPQGWNGKQGKISTQMITTEIPDYKQRLFYVSGSHSLVTAVKAMLSELGVEPWQIKTDFFPGYA